MKNPLANVKNPINALKNKKLTRPSFKTVKRISLGLLVLSILYYPLGSIYTHVIFDDTTVELPANTVGSHSVARAVQLIDREVNEHNWTPNDPFFYYTIFLDNMLNYQKGIVAAVSRFTEVMRDDIGRGRGTDPEDKNLNDATGRFKIDPTIYTWDPTVSLWPQAAAETQFDQGIFALRQYNQRVADNKAVFDHRADNFMALLERISKDLGDMSAAINNGSDDYTLMGWFDWDADDTFYAAKGRLYAYCMILQGATVDFKKEIADKSLGKVWLKMLHTLCRGAELDPWIIRNGPRDSISSPNHLVALGFDVLLARAQLKETIDILLK